MDKSIVPVNQIAVRSSNCYEFSNSNPAEVVEIEDDPVETMKKQMEDLKLNFQFNEKNVPKILKNLIRSSDLQEIWTSLDGQFCKMMFGGVIMNMKKNENDWLISYKNTEETIKCDDHEQFIIDNLWFVLKNPNLTLNAFVLEAQYYPKSEDNSLKTENECSQKLNANKFILLLQSMLDSIDHQIRSYMFICIRFNEDTLSSLLKYFNAGIIEEIDFEMSWKEEGNYQKLKEIAKTEQWKHAKKICSLGVARLEIKDFSHCEYFRLELESITPEDVLSLVKQVFDSAGYRCCQLACESKNYDLDAILNNLRSQYDESNITKIKTVLPLEKCSYKIVKSAECVFYTLNGNDIVIQNY